LFSLDIELFEEKLRPAARASPASTGKQLSETVFQGAGQGIIDNIPIFAKIDQILEGG